MTRMDMEDMLSSIRRLVSDKKPDDSRETVEESGLLLLTPAFRVMDAPDGETTRAETADLLAHEPEIVAAPGGMVPAEAEEQTPEQPVAEPEAPPSTLELRIAELERAITGSDEQFEPDGSEPIAEHEPELHVLEQYRDRFASLRLSELGEVGGEGQAAGDDGAEGADEGPLQLSDVAIFTHTPRSRQKAADAAQRVDSADQGSGGAALEAHEPAGQLDETAPIEAIVADEATADSDEMQTEEAVTATVDGVPVEPVAEDAAPELRVPVIETVAEEAMEPAEPVENDQLELAQTESAVAAAEPTPSELIDPDDDLLVDEELLRQVVADIVRDELQGRLGERITRNVRRMVRQEIERAMSLKSLK